MDNLPEAVFTKQHLDIKTILVNKVVDLLQDSTEMTDYGIAKAWNDKSQERISLKTLGFTIAIQITEV